MKKRIVRARKSGLTQGDQVEVRINETWRRGQVSRSVNKGAIMDVRMDDGKVLTNLTAKDVRAIRKEEGVMPKKKEENHAIPRFTASSRPADIIVELEGRGYSHNAMLSYAKAEFSWATKETAEREMWAGVIKLLDEVKQQAS